MAGRITRRALVARGIAAGAALSLAAPGPGGATVAYRRLYVAITNSMTIYDVPSFGVVKTVALPTSDGPRGIACHPGIGSLWITHGSTRVNGQILRYDIATDAVVWNTVVPFGIDQLAVTLDGAHLYVPSGEESRNNLWHVLDPLTGAQTGTVAGGAGPHNTVARTRHVYLGGLRSTFLFLDNGFQIGPLRAGCRPFTVDAAEQFVYTTSTHVRGFQVASIASGKVLATVDFGPVPSSFRPTAPSHGISLSPDGSQLWVLDTPAQMVRIYTAGASPTHIADVPIHPIAGTEVPATTPATRRTGWLTHGRDGVHVYVGDSGSVISTATRTQVALLGPLQNGRHGFLEVIFDAAGKPVDTSTHFGLSY